MRELGASRDYGGTAFMENIKKVRIKIDTDIRRGRKENIQNLF